MKRKGLILTGLLIAALLLLWLLRPFQPKQIVPKPIPSPSPQATTASPGLQSPERNALVEKVERALAIPIAFYGKIIDQNGDPVPDATANYTALDKFDAPGSQYQSKSDADGNFSISGISGAVLNVGVRKEGYYMIDGKSAGAFAYGVGPDSTRREPPTKENPEIFLLQKMGIAEPLICITQPDLSHTTRWNTGRSRPQER